VAEDNDEVRINNFKIMNI